MRALKVSVYTGSRDTPLVSAACWIWWSHFRLAQFLRPSVWLLSKAPIRNSTTLSRTWSSLPLSSDTTNSMYLWNCFEDNLTSWPGWEFGNWTCSLAKRRKWETENGLEFINLRESWSPHTCVLWISECIKGISEPWDWLPLWIQYEFYAGYVCFQFCLQPGEFPEPPVTPPDCLSSQSFCSLALSLVATHFHSYFYNPK